MPVTLSGSADIYSMLIYNVAQELEAVLTK